MEVKLNIEASQLGDTVVELFKNIPQEKKEEMALQIMQKWLEEPYQVERQVADRDVLIDLRNKNDYEGYGEGRRNHRDMPDDELRKTSKYHERMRNFKSSKETMIQEISQVAIATYRTKSSELVQNDEQLKKAFSVVAENIKQDFPAFVHDAMMYWFTQQFQTVMSMAGTSMNKSLNNEQMIKNINGNLGINY